MSKHWPQQTQIQAPKPEPKRFEALAIYRDAEGWRVATVQADESMILRKSEPNLPLIAKDEWKKASVGVWQKAGLL